jgi:CHAD domain-containing protein
MAMDIDRMERPIRKVRKLLKKMSSNPTPKQVHDLRTNSRKLEATLHTTNPNQNDRKVLKQISQLRKRAGKVRDMDVLTAYATQLPHEGNEEECSVRLLEHLGAVREREAEKLYKAMQQHTSVLRKRLKRSSKDVTRPDGDTSSRITSAALQLISELEQPAKLHRRNLHAYRLKVKELQNLLRLSASSKDEAFVESLGHVKDAIGEWHDWMELQSIANTMLDHPRCKLLQELKKTTGERFEHALGLTESMRKKYLGASARKPGGRRKPPRPSEPVWSATSALAG